MELTRVGVRFESDGKVAELASAAEPQKHRHATVRTARRSTGRLAEGFPGCRHHGLAKCFDRFWRPNARSNAELDALVEQAGQVIAGIEPQQLRDSGGFREMVANDFTRNEQGVGDLLVDGPRRNIFRRAGSSSEGGAFSHRPRGSRSLA